MAQENFTCRVDEDSKQALLKAAKANDRPASVLIRDFMRDYVRQTAQARLDDSEPGAVAVPSTDSQ